MSVFTTVLFTRLLSCWTTTTGRLLGHKMGNVALSVFPKDTATRYRIGSRTRFRNLSIISSAQRRSNEFLPVRTNVLCSAHPGKDSSCLTKKSLTINKVSKRALKNEEQFLHFLALVTDNQIEALSGRTVRNNVSLH